MSMTYIIKNCLNNKKLTVANGTSTMSKPRSFLVYLSRKFNIFLLPHACV
jgi:hypothetical protein